MKKRWVSIMVALTVGMVCVSGCGSSQADTSQTATEKSATETTTEDATESVEENKDKEKAENSDGKTLTLIYPSDITSLDPINDATMLKEVAGVLETLVNVDSDFNLQPGLAESWKRLDDTTWEFKLKKGVKFHDGTDFNAEAVKWCFERTMENSDSFASYTSIASVEVVDDYTVKFISSEPTGEIPEALTNVIAVIYAKSSVAEDGEFLQPVGTGYFKYADFDVSTGTFKCDVFDEYWGEKPESSIQTRVVKAISDSSTRSLAVQNGEADIATDTPFSDLQTLKGNDDLTVKQFNTARTYFYSYNLNKDYLSDPNVRKALIYAINTEELVKDVLLGVGGVPHGIFMDDVKWNNPDVNAYGYDVEMAKKLLDDAGFVDSDNDGIREYKGEEVQLHIITGSRRPGNGLIVQATQGYFAAIGIDAVAEVLDGNVQSEAVNNGEFDLTLNSAATGYIPSASYSLRQYYHSESNNAKCIGYSNPELDKLIDECRNMEDSEEKNEVSRQAQMIAQDDVAIYTVALYGGVFVMNKDIEGFSYSAAVHDFVVPYTTDIKE